MKKLIFLFAILAAFVFTAEAQKIKVVAFANDTVTDTGTATMATVKFSTANSVSVVIKTTQLTGTIAGSIVFQGSIDGTNYATIDTNTYTPTDAGTYAWTNTTTTNYPAYRYYRLLWTGSGTQSSKLEGYYSYFERE